MSAKLILARIVSDLPRYRYALANETQLHQAICAVLKLAGIAHVREHVAGPRDRFDILCEHGVVIEAKVKGSFSAALRQVDRYCARGDVNAVVLATSKHWGESAALDPNAEFHGKPVRMVRLLGQAF